MFNIARLSGGLIVSCQPEGNEAFYTPEFTCGMAQAAALSGAAGLRLDSPRTLKLVATQLSLPKIGIWKQKHAGSEVYITPTLEAAEQVLAAGAEIIAIDATPRKRPAESLTEIVTALKGRVCLMADISTQAEAETAAELGFDCVGTTLAGYTAYSRQQDAPDFELLQSLVQSLALPVIMEGRIWTPEQAAQALKLGAHAVVVGSAITRPQAIARRYLAAMKASTSEC